MAKRRAKARPDEAKICPAPAVSANSFDKKPVEPPVGGSYFAF
jgi:hypothetical protein